MWTLTIGWALAAECPEPASTVSLGATLDRAEASYGDLDLDAFDEAVDSLRAQVPCLDEVVPSPLVASVHRFEGLKAFVDGAPDRSRRAFAAARSLEPAYRFPRSVVPEGNPVLDDYEAMDPEADGATATVAAPAVGSFRFDGRVGAQRPTQFPTLYQRLGGDGEVVASAYLWPSMPLPPYEVAPASPEGSEGLSQGARVARIGLLAGAGAAAVTSGVLYGLAAQQHARFDDPSTPYVELESARRATNTLAAGSGVSALVAVGAGVGGVLVGVF